MNILVTGGAGYIGSVVVELLLRKKHNVIIIDNLSTGSIDAIPDKMSFFKGDFGDKDNLDDIFSNTKIDLVMHFAALAIVEDSVNQKRKYYENNVIQTRNLLSKMVEYKVDKIIFSSTCAIFKNKIGEKIDEKCMKKPLNYYGKTKLDVEKLLVKYNKKYGIKFCSLRYFNVAGATKKNGERRTRETHLIPNALGVVLGERDRLQIYGNDYNTIDGTCIRDYIHVSDIAEAHILAIKYLKNNDIGFFNLGNEKGYSVLDIVNMVEKVTKISICKEINRRRKGDPDFLVGNSSLVKQKIGWFPRKSKLKNIVHSAFLFKKYYNNKEKRQ